MKLIHILEKRAQSLKEDTWNRLLSEPVPLVRKLLEEAYNSLHDAQVALEQAKIEGGERLMTESRARCKCEHVAHFDKTERTKNGNPAHKYQQEFSFTAMTHVETPYGRFHVCMDCAKDCLQQYTDSRYARRPFQPSLPTRTDGRK